MSNNAFGPAKPAFVSDLPERLHTGRKIVTVMEAIRQDIERERNYESSGKPRLWSSDMGYCPRKALMRITGYEKTIDFSTESKLKMRGGVILEDETGRALQEVHGEQNVDTQFRFSTDIWSGKGDFVLYHGTMLPIIVEHKATGDKWWNYKGNIPNPAHVGQLWLYGELYREAHGIMPQLILFYRSWGHYAELELTEGAQGAGINCVGLMDDKPYESFVTPHPRSLRQALESYYATVQWDGTTATCPELPPRLDDMEAGCNFNGKPSCQMYYHCYPEEA